MSDYDAIVVGSGCAGPIAAYELARAGKSVLVVERGDTVGSKNMTGGRLYAHTLRRLFPEFAEQAPVERRIIRERISLIAPDASTTLDFSSQDMLSHDCDSYSVLRAKFDPWLAAQAEDAGADIITGFSVDELLKDESGKVCGIRAGEDELSCDAVVLCDGVNSLLAEQAVGYRKPAPTSVALGVKEVFALPAGVITDRVLAESDDDGAAWLFVGDVTKGSFGGGFMYTNRESVSLGIVVGIESLCQANRTIVQMMEEFKKHPAVAPIIRDGQMVEHSGHMVPEGGFRAMPQLVGNGVVLAGDTAMMCINYGYAVRGMDYALAAGQLAGQAVVQALDSGDTSTAGLACYTDMLDQSFVMKDLRSFAASPAFLRSCTRVFGEYPKAACAVMGNLFVVDGQPVHHVKEVVKPALRGIGIRNVIKDVRGALRAL